MILEEIENVLEEYDVHYQINDYLPEMYSWDYKNLSTEFSSECLNILMDKFKDTFKQVIAKNKFYGGSDAGYYAEKLGVPTIILVQVVYNRLINQMNGSILKVLWIILRFYRNG